MNTYLVEVTTFLSSLRSLFEDKGRGDWVYETMETGVKESEGGGGEPLPLGYPWNFRDC